MTGLKKKKKNIYIQKIEFVCWSHIISSDWKQFRQAAKLLMKNKTKNNIIEHGPKRLKADSGDQILTDLVPVVAGGRHCP